MYNPCNYIRERCTLTVSIAHRCTDNSTVIITENVYYHKREHERRHVQQRVICVTGKQVSTISYPLKATFAGATFLTTKAFSSNFFVRNATGIEHPRFKSFARSNLRKRNF